jgi:hypothetical protein
MPFDEVSKIMRGRFVAIAERMTDQLERRAKAGKASQDDLRGMARAWREVEALARGAESPGKSGSDREAERKAAGGTDAAEETPLLKKMAQGMRARARGEGQASPSSTTTDTALSAVDDSTQPTTTEEHDAEQEEDEPNSLDEREISERLDAAVGGVG